MGQWMQSSTYRGPAWYGMLAVAFSLLLVSALLAGLTLAICGLDPTWLHLRSVTGTAKERKRATKVKKMKRNGTWLLCSLIICSVASGESLPIVIEGLCPGSNPLIPILVSTISMGIFAEILPQYIVPKHAITWGYYCWPLMMTCMWLTAIVSYPLALLLDWLFGAHKDLYGNLTNDQLATLVKTQERSEHNPDGGLGPHATRVVLGALNLDGRRIDRVVDVSEQPSNGDETDVEKAEFSIVQGMIVKWWAVKTIDINEAINQGFIDKIKGWSYSRIPVIGKSEGKAAESEIWEGTKIFGFVHIKNLVGIDLKTHQEGGTVLHVKDLPLYPIPIVRDSMSVYELLDLFQLGMSRMAVVVAHTSANYLNAKLDDSPGGTVPRWTAESTSQAQPTLRIGNSGDWATDTLEAAKANIEDCDHKVIGIRSPKPIGIVTFEDVIDTILQKTSRDEKDYFGRGSQLPLTKTMKLGDGAQNPTLVRPQEVDSPKSKHARNKLRKTPHYVKSIPADRAPSSLRDTRLPATVRRRNVSKNVQVAAVDGANDDHSSYTQNSRGGFHESSSSCGNGMVLMSNDVVQLRSCSPPKVYSPHVGVNSGTYSLPSRKGDSAFTSVGLTPISRRVSAAPRIPNSVRRVTPFSRHNYSSYERMVDAAEDNGDPVMFTSPKVATQSLDTDKASSILQTAHRSQWASTSNTISSNSWYGEETSGHVGETLKSEASTQGERLFPSGGQEDRAFKSPVSYDGFPPELLELEYDKENRLPNYVSKTLPRMQGLVNSENEDGQPPSREKSFHDDRALLPSQRRALNSNATNAGGTRSISLWF